MLAPASVVVVPFFWAFLSCCFSGFFAMVFHLPAAARHILSK